MSCLILVHKQKQKEIFDDKNLLFCGVTYLLLLYADIVVEAGFFSATSILWWLSLSAPCFVTAFGAYWLRTTSHRG